MSGPEAFEILLTFPAETGLEVVAAETAARLAEHAGADEAAIGDVRMAVIEGCVNAIEHAYGENGTENCTPCRVDLRFRLNSAIPDRGAPARLTIRISDQGHGFDLKSYEEPTLEKKLHSHRKRGWGLKLMRGYMDDFRIETGQGGTIIEMTKLLVPQRA